MNQFENTLNWLQTHRDLAYSLIRIYLGIALFIRGWILFSDPALITELARVDKIYWWYSYIIIAHSFGGLLLAIGFLTRFAALLQIPILVGAVFLIHLKKGLMTAGQSLELAALVLILLIVYFVFGSGILALDKYLADKKSGALHIAKNTDTKI